MTEWPFSLESLMLGQATFSPCRNYRYSLWRHFSDLFQNGKGYAMFIGLNPSTADENNDDPTVRRCINYAKDWGFDSLCMTNLFGWRSTDPAGMLEQDDPIGPENNKTLIELAQNAGIVVAAWGTHGTHRDRHQEVCGLIKNLHCLHLTKDGLPGHPLYLPKTLKPVLMSEALACLAPGENKT